MEEVQEVQCLCRRCRSGGLLGQQGPGVVARAKVRTIKVRTGGHWGKGIS